MRPPGSVFAAAWVVVQTRGRCSSRSRRRRLVHAQLWPLSLFSGREALGRGSMLRRSHLVLLHRRLTFSVQKRIGIVSGIIQRGRRHSHPPPSVYLFLIAASAIFAVSCWSCTCFCGLVCAFIRVRWTPWHCWSRWKEKRLKKKRKSNHKSMTSSQVGFQLSPLPLGEI